jgi:hypothetical protein
MLKTEEKIIKAENVLDNIPEVDEVELEAYDRSTHYKTIVNKETLSTISVVPNDHHYISHRHVINVIDKLDNYNIKQIHLIGENNERMIVVLNEREPRKIELMPEDFIECGVEIINDYSKNCGLSIQSTATRIVCDNGMVAACRSKKMKVYAFGAQDFHDELLTKINDGFDYWSNVVGFFNEAATKVVPVKDVIAQHAFLSDKYLKEITSKLQDEESLYTIYNEYTRVITHSFGNEAPLDKVNQYLKRANKVLKTQPMIVSIKK